MRQKTLKNMAEVEELWKMNKINLQSKMLLLQAIAFEQYEAETGKKIVYEEFKEVLLNAQTPTN